MKNKTYILNTLLAAVLGIALLVCIFVRTFAPNVIIPELDILNMLLISLVTLLADHYLAKDAPRCYICIPVFSALSFALLPYAACFVGAMEAVKLGAVGCMVFTAATWLFTSMMDRLSTGPAAKAAPFMSAFGLYLAFQAMAGILL